MKFRQCMTRGLTLIKMYFVDTLQATVREVQHKLQTEKTAEGLSEASETALFYAKFRAVAPRLKTLVTEIEKRSRSRKEYEPHVHLLLHPYPLTSVVFSQVQVFDGRLL